MRPLYYKEWVQKYANEQLEEYYIKLGNFIVMNRNEIQNIVQEQVEDFMQTVCILQGRGDFNVGCIQGALLASSIINGRYVIIYEAFDELQDYGEVCVAKEYDISWLFSGWEKLEKDLKKTIKEYGYSGKLSEEAVITFLLEQVPKCAQVLAHLTKYVFKNMSLFTYYSKMKRSKEFYFSIGGYHDSRIVLFQEKEEKDIFQAGDIKSFPFQIFAQCIYTKRNFRNFEFQNALFQDCRFKDMIIEDCDFSDCEFNNCTFKSVKFKCCLFHGTYVVESQLLNVRFEDCSCKHGLLINEGKVKNIYRQARFVKTIFNEVEFDNKMEEDWEYVSIQKG